MNRLNEMKDLIGFNLAALSFLKKEVEVNSNQKIFGPPPSKTLESAPNGPTNKRGIKKRKN
jgi:hypothetical protein